jgi:hypothetical protein
MSERSSNQPAAGYFTLYNGRGVQDAKYPTLPCRWVSKRVFLVSPLILAREDLVRQ